MRKSQQVLLIWEDIYKASLELSDQIIHQRIWNIPFLFLFYDITIEFPLTLQKNIRAKNTCSQWTFGSTAEKAILLSPQVVDRAKDSEQGVLLQKSPPQKGDAWKIPMGFEALRTHLLWICMFSQAEIGKNNLYVIFELHHSTTWVVNLVDFSLF